MSSKWIDIDTSNFDAPGAGEVGWVGYCVLTSRGSMSALSIRAQPLRTNQSNEPRLTGWCGETNNKSRTACGAWKITKLNAAKDRAYITELLGADLCSFLTNDGHPELIPAYLAEAWHKGAADGVEDVETVLREQGEDVVIATLNPGHLGWDAGAINAGAHRLAGVSEKQRDVYYRAYAEAARARAIEIRDEKQGRAA